jgi:hypothetical protein
MMSEEDKKKIDPKLLKATADFVQNVRWPQVCPTCGVKVRKLEEIEHQHLYKEFEIDGEVYGCYGCKERECYANYNITKVESNPVDIVSTCDGCSYLKIGTMLELSPVVKPNPFQIYGPGTNNYGQAYLPQPKVMFCSLYSRVLENSIEDTTKAKPLTRFCFTWKR